MKKLIMIILLICSLSMTANSMENPKKGLGQAPQIGTSAPISLSTPSLTNEQLKTLELALNSTDKARKKSAQETIELCPQEALPVITCDEEKTFFLISKDMQQKSQVFKDMQQSQLFQNVQQFDKDNIMSLPLTSEQLALTREACSNDFHQVLQTKYNSIEKIFDLYQLRKVINFLNIDEMLLLINKHIVQLASCNHALMHLKTLTGHTHNVTALAYSRDGTSLASGSHDNSVKVWDVNTMKCTNTFREEFSVNSVAYNSQGDLISHFGLGNSATIKIRNLHKQIDVKTFNNTSDWLVVSYNPRGNFMALGSYPPKSATHYILKIHNLLTGEDTTLDAVRNPFVVAFHPNNRHLACGTNYGTISIWDLTTKTNIKTIKNNFKHYTSIAYSPDCNYLALGCESNAIEIWNLEAETYKTLDGHDAWPHLIAYSNNGDYLISCSEADSKVWDLSTDTCIYEMRKSNPCIQSATFKHDSKELALGVGKEIELYIFITPEEIGQELIEFIAYIYEEILPNPNNISVSHVDPKLYTLLKYCSPEFQEFIKRYIDIKKSEEEQSCIVS